MDKQMSGEGVWVGVDPGGEKNFGVALLSDDGETRTRSVSCADEAVEFVQRNVSQHLHGIGIDSPMWWSSGRSSARKSDGWIRREYGLSGGNVQHANSLRGAVLVQGAMFAWRMREAFPNVRITESHPKAVLRALKMEWGEFVIQFKLRTSQLNEHERDAVISAVAAREGFLGRWPKDLALEDRFPSEQDPSRYWLAPMHYFWPDTTRG